VQKLDTAMAELQREAAAHNSTREELEASRVLHQATSQQLAAMISELSDTIAQLDSNSLSSEAAAVRAQKPVLEVLLQSFKDRLGAIQAQHNDQAQVSIRLSLEKQLAEFRSQFYQERNDHEETKSEVSTLIIVVGALGGVAFLLLLAVGGLLVYWKRRHHGTAGGTPHEGDVAEVVVGRPVDSRPGNVDPVPGGGQGAKKGKAEFPGGMDGDPEAGSSGDRHLPQGKDAI